MKDFSAKAYRQKLKDQGVFHTDKKLAEILRSYGKEHPRDVYDPTCGTGTLLSVFPDDVPKYGQELEAEYLEVAKEALTNFTGVCGDTLTEPAFKDRKFDFIIANYPFSVKWEPNKEDARFKDWCTVPPPSKADYAFIMHMLYMLAEDGVCVTLNFPGILYRQAREGKIRKEIVDRGLLKRVVHVPGGYFEDTDIATAILVLSKAPSDGFVIFEDLEIEEERRVPMEEIRENDYTLSVATYIDRVEEREEIDPIENAKTIRAITVQNLARKLEIDLIDAILQCKKLGRESAIEEYIAYCAAIGEVTATAIQKALDVIAREER